jgi:hypothetical protein
MRSGGTAVQSFECVRCESKMRVGVTNRVVIQRIASHVNRRYTLRGVRRAESNGEWSNGLESGSSTPPPRPLPPLSESEGCASVESMASGRSRVGIQDSRHPRFLASDRILVYRAPIQPCISRGHALTLAAWRSLEVEQPKGFRALSQMPDVTSITFCCDPTHSTLLRFWR